MSPDRIRPGSARRRDGENGGPPSEEVADLLPEEVPAGVPLDEEALPEALETDETRIDPDDAVPELDSASFALDDSLQDDSGPEDPGPEDSLLDNSPADDSEEPLSLLDVPVAPRGGRHGAFARLYYGETRVDFVGRKRKWFAFSAAVVLAGVISLGFRGLNLGIDFVGGTSWTIPTNSLTITQVQNSLSGILSGETITVLGTGGNQTIEVEAKLPKGQSSTTTTRITGQVSNKLAALTHTSVDNVTVESVGPSWGSQITNKAIEALIVFFILIAIYISIFFEWRMAVAAIVAVLHDILVTVGIYSLTGLEVTPDTVVAILTILGYSLYDTIVVFDRVRDNTRHLSVRDRLTYSDVVNLSMNQTLARSINTSLVAIMPILSVLVIGAEVLGATTLEYFGIALLVGLTTGAYSSIFIASPLVAVMKEREPRYRQLRERLAARGADRTLLSASDVARGAVIEFGPRSRTRARSEGESDDGETSSPTRPTQRPRPAPTRRPASRTRSRGGRR